MSRPTCRCASSRRSRDAAGVRVLNWPARLLAILGLAFLTAAAAATLPDHPYQRWQLVENTLYANATWAYERIHLRPAADRRRHPRLVARPARAQRAGDRRAARRPRASADGRQPVGDRGRPQPRMGDRRPAVRGEAAEAGGRRRQRDDEPLGPPGVQVRRPGGGGRVAAGAVPPQLGGRPRLSAVPSALAVQRVARARPVRPARRLRPRRAMRPSPTIIPCRGRWPTASAST